MKKTLTLLIATTALTAAAGLPAFSAMRASPDGASFGVFSAVLDAEPETLPLVFVSDDDDDDHDDDDRGYRNGDDDDDDDDDCDGDDDDDDDDECSTGALNPVPAGTVAPPQNGLFGNGAPPQVQMK